MTNTDIPRVQPDPDRPNGVCLDIVDDGHWCIELHPNVTVSAVVDTVNRALNRAYEAGRETPGDTQLDEDLQRQITGLQAELNLARASRDGWQSDFQHVASKLLEQAIDRQWCSEYDSFCRETNGELRYGELIVRQWDVTGTITLDVSFTRGHSDDAAEMLRQFAQSVSGQVDRAGYDFSITDYNYEVDSDEPSE